MVEPVRLAAWLYAQFRYNAALSYSEKCFSRFGAAGIRFLPYAEAVALRESIVCIPTDMPAPIEAAGAWSVPFNGTSFTLWNRIPRPEGLGWSTYPGPDSPLFHRHESGTILPAWNIFANLCDMLLFREEYEFPNRDRHGRFPLESSPRYKAGLLRVPAFNEALAFLVAAVHGRCIGVAEPNIDDLLVPLKIVLSHDCDILSGGDFITQSIRLLNVIRPLTRARIPNLRKLWHIPVNIVAPRRHYFDNAIGMLELERQYGYRSVFYILNGTGGRFGARGGSEIAGELVRSIPDQWEVGMHYNYDTFRNNTRFRQQKVEIERFNARRVMSGRAHYLRFDPLQSFSCLQLAGIRFDESLGYAEYAGYRCGIAGIFKPLNPVTGTEYDVLELPMTFMDRTIEMSGSFDPMLEHLRKIGGALSILYHPGSFHNTEEPELVGGYHAALRRCYAIDAVSLLPRDVQRLVDRIDLNARG
ncbi:hypothetical protein [Polaromonas sp. YR568]|uniref:hypothetical protein n=1 Tax=Polaromonas sp. YR568 TaxID=1855301 RepID=UPI0031379EB1